MPDPNPPARPTEARFSFGTGGPFPVGFWSGGARGNSPALGEAGEAGEVGGGTPAGDCEWLTECDRGCELGLPLTLPSCGPRRADVAGGALCSPPSVTESVVGGGAGGVATAATWLKSALADGTVACTGASSDATLCVCVCGWVGACVRAWATISTYMRVRGAYACAWCICDMCIHIHTYAYRDMCT